MARGKVLNKNPQEGDIKIMPSNPNAKWRYTNGEWVYIKKPKGYFKKDQPKPQKPKVIFPPVTLPDHIKATNYSHYYVSKYGVAYREPRRCDESGRYGEVNEYGLIELTTQLRGNPNCGPEFMYESVNIYFYDEDGKNIGYKKRNIHQLVAETWIPNPHGYTEVLHGNKGNRCNDYRNLRWGTHKENMEEASHTLPDGTIRNVKGHVSKYIKKDGEWVLIPSTAPPWNKGLKGSSWNTGLSYSLPDRHLPEGTISIRSNGSKWKKENGKWVYQKKIKQT
tara:strand:+ start:178 stop:1014 length:837 start_codon:yes stop_codon:yes gene_type:complete